MKRLLNNTVKEMFGIDRQFTNAEVLMFYALVTITSALAIYLL